MARWVYQGADSAFLAGREFSNGRTFRGTRVEESNRIDLLVAQSRGRTVLHVGFADHSPLIDEKRRNRKWLHDRVSEVADRAVGVDIDSAVVEMLRSRGVQDIYALDVTQEVSEPAIRDTAFDIVILGEVLEHVGNPVAFLQGLRVNYGQPGQRLLVTVPNALNLRSVMDIARTQECVNTDHRFWFTPYTLARVLTEAGYTVDRVETCLGSEVPNTVKGRAYRALVGRFGLLQDHLVAFARVAEPEATS